jgi:lipoyl(octanoyl) transferase
MTKRANPHRESLSTEGMFSDSAPVEWVIQNGLLDYDKAISEMERLAGAIAIGHAQERVWLVEHPPLFTAGTSASDEHLLNNALPVHKTGRGGEHTYHGPGQRICYVMLDLNKRKQDLRLYVATLEQWIINTLDHFNIKGERREDRVGVWVKRPEKPALPDGTPREDKIAAIGIRVRKWVTFHGISINVEPDLSHYEGIIPCGVEGHGITSLVDLGLPVTMEDLDIALKQEFEKLFGKSQ